MDKDGQVRFRYRAFLEYFIAARMEEEEQFRNWVLEQERYLSFFNEIEYYAGIRRSDLSLVRLVAERFKRLTGELEQQTDWFIDLNAINDLKPPHQELQAGWIDDIDRQLHAPRLLPHERDDILEAELPRDVGDRQEVFRPLFEDLGEKWRGSLLLYSRVVKNMELIPDAEKLMHLDSVLQGGAQFTYHTLLLVPQLVKHRKMRVNGIEYHVLFPESMSDGEVARGLSWDSASRFGCDPILFID